MEVINFAETPSLVSQYMSELRDVNVQSDMLRFRRNLERIGEIMAYEMSKRMRYKTVDVTTPLAVAPSQVLDEQVVFATIFRAGIPFHKGFLITSTMLRTLLSRPTASIAKREFRCVYRIYSFATYRRQDPRHCRPDACYRIVDGPVLPRASDQREPAHVHVASIIASRKAIDYVKATFPADKTTVWVGAIDEVINDHSYIVPGLGDAGDLAYGIKE